MLVALFITLKAVVLLSVCVQIEKDVNNGTTLTS